VGASDYSAEACRLVPDSFPSLLQFSRANYSVSERGSTATITVTKWPATPVPVQVHYETRDLTAVAGIDYTHTEGDLTFSPGTTSRTFAVPVTNTTAADRTRTFLLRLSDPRNAGLGTQKTAVLAIQNDDGGGTFKFSATGYTYPDTRGYATITVTRSGGSASGASVKYRTGTGTAVPSTDYTAIDSPQSLTFGAGETSKTFRVYVTGNSKATDSSKTVTLLLSEPSGGAILGTPSVATLRITNDDKGGALRFGASSYSVAENADHATVTVTRSGGAGSDVAVEILAIDGSAKTGLDYRPVSPTSLSFSPGETSKTFDVPLVYNVLATGTRTLTLKLNKPSGGATIGSPRATTVNITKAGIRFSQTAYSAMEGSGFATITVARTRRSGAATVQVQTANDSATAPADYTAIDQPQVITFSHGQTSKTFTVAIADNPARSTNRSLRLRLFNATGEPLGEPKQATLTILDREGAELQLTSFEPPTVGLVGKPIVAKNIVRNNSALSTSPSTVRFVLSRDAIRGNADDVTLGTRYARALEAGASSAMTTTLTIPESTATGAYTLFAIVDAENAVVEQDEDNNVRSAPLMLVASLVRTFTVSGVLSNVSCMSSLRDGRAVVLGSLAVSGQTGSSLTGFLALDYPLTAGLKTTGSFNGAVDPDGRVSGRISYATKQGATTVTIGMAALAGAVRGGSLEIELAGQSTSRETCDFTAWLVSPAVPVALMSFHHDTTVGPLDVANGEFIAAPSFPVSINRYRVLLQVANVPLPFTPPANVRFTGPGGSQFSDTAAAEVNQLANAAAEYRSPWVSAPSVPPAGDWTGAYEENYYDYPMPDPQGASHLVVPVPTFVQTNGALTRVSWGYHAADGTRLGGAPPFVRKLRLHLLDPCGVILHDSLAHLPTMTDWAPKTPTTLASVAEVRFEYEDDLENLYTVRYGTATLGDCKLVQFAAPRFSEMENTSTAEITLRRMGDLTGAVVVNFTTSDGTAHAGRDYTVASQLVTLGPNVSSLVVGVPILNNESPQGPRTVLLRLDGPSGGASLGPLDTAVLTINDDEPRVRFSSVNYTVGEGSRAATIVVQRTGATTPVVSLPYWTSDGTALAGFDYIGTAGTLTFGPGQTTQTFTVPILNDSLAEGDQTLTVALGDPIGALLDTPNTAALTIRDNEAGGAMAFAAGSFSVAADAGAVTITVIRTGGTGGGATIRYATRDGTGQAGVDYEAASGTLTFAAGEMSKTFTVQVHGNAGSSASKSVTLTLSNPSTGAALGTPTSATLWIVN
jgi:hypothetical protein